MSDDVESVAKHGSIDTEAQIVDLKRLELMIATRRKRLERMVCIYCGKYPFANAYMVLATVWKEAGCKPDQFCCLGCLPDRLCRPLRIEDFPKCAINELFFVGLALEP